MNSSFLSFVPGMHTQMMQNKFLLAFKGAFSHEISLAMLSVCENRIVSDGAEFTTRKKIFNVMMSCLENINIQPDENTDKESGAMVMLGKNNEEYFVYTVATIENNKVEGIEDQLSRINELNNSELKLLYKKFLQSLNVDETAISDTRLIDIARKSGHKIEFEISGTSPTTSLFAMKTTVAAIYA
ncbi:MAG: SiaB family protein kinase [Bacteroidia bacterium]